MQESFKDKFLRFITNRLLIMSGIICIMFYLLVIKLFELQIVNGKHYNEVLTTIVPKSLEIEAPRGTIYDRFGRPMAINKSAYTIKIDPGVAVDNLNDVMRNLVLLLEKNGESYVDEFPISKEKPYYFMFNESETREKRWKEDMSVPVEYDAEKTFAHLRDFFKLPAEMSDEEARKILSFRSLVYLQRYKQHAPITIAFDVKNETVVDLEENSEKYTSIFVDIVPLREYPAAGYASHIIGYIGKINEKELEANKDNGYKNTDLIGKTGLERSFEENFRGVKGEKLVYVNTNGRPVQTIDTELPMQGDKLFLTLDLELQKKVYHILENTLTDVIRAKLVGGNPKDFPVTQKQLFASMVKSNNIPIKKIMLSEEGSDSFRIKQFVVDRLPQEPFASVQEEQDEIKRIIVEGIEKGLISSTEMLLMMFEQGVFTAEQGYIDNLRRRRLGPLQVILDMLDNKQLTPQMTALDPSTGAAVVVDLETGGVIASVGYPTYDNNQLVNNLNSEYYSKINNDPTLPMWNRPFMEPRAPGSTFKMISAITGLEEGVINSKTRIYDEVSFTKTGVPYSNCWSSVSHGSITVKEALKVSCNYFFTEMAYRMGNAKDGNSTNSISAMNKYMTAFGLNDRTGVEIGEFRDTIPDDVLAISSPSYMEYIVKSRNPEARSSEYAWTDGETIRTAYGQSKNNYTAAAMVKYTAALANRGVRYQMHFMDKIESYNGNLIKKFEPVIENVVEINDSTWDIVYSGMLAVTEETGGTALSVFKDFPIRVAGKTGTAQEDPKRNDHSSFAGFAPFENPQIAVYVVIPYSDSRTVIAPASRVAEEIMGEYFGLNSMPELPLQINSLSK